MDAKLLDNLLATEAAPLTYGGVGDAYGFCFEFTEAEFVSANNDLTYHQHPTFLDIQPGVYSDDTQMHIALAEVIASGQDWEPKLIAQSFVDVFKRDTRKGYAKGFYAFLESINSGEEFVEKIRPDSERNGAAMRAPVIGLISELDQVMEKSEIQAKLTHDTKGGVDSAIASSLMAHYFAYDLGPKEQLPDFLNKYVPGHNWNSNWSEPVECHGVSTIQAAITAICNSETMSELLVKCVEFTGDVDSVATIALASASGSASFTRDIPTRLWQGFEPSDYGLKYLLDLDARVRAITTECAKDK